MDFSKVKSFSILEGKVKSLSINGVKVWSEKEETPFDDTLLLCKWTFKDTIDLLDTTSFVFDFTTSASTYGYMSFTLTTLLYSGVSVYNKTNGWVGAEYQEITITDISKLTNAQKQELYTWLVANAIAFDDSLILGRWTFNETPTFALVNAKTYNIDFISNGETYDNIFFDWLDADSQEIKYGKNLDYLLAYSPDIYASSDGWINEYAKLIDITSIASLTKAQKQDLYGLLLTIAVKEQEDELQGLWLLNDNPDGILNTVNLNFQSNGQNYTSFKTEEGGDGILVYFNATLVCSADRVIEVGKWVNQSYRYINITSKLSEVTNGSTLLSWLKANASKVKEPLKGLWLWDTTETGIMGDSNDGIYYVNFISNNNSFTKMSFSYLTGPYPTGFMQTIKYGDITILDDMDWTNEAYQTIEILDEITAVENGYELLRILQRHAGYPLKAGTYLFKEVIVPYYPGYIDFRFYSNSILFTSMGDQDGDGDLQYKTESGAWYTVYKESTNTWDAQAYRTIIISTDQPVEREFYEWLMENAELNHSGGGND